MREEYELRKELPNGFSLFVEEVCRSPVVAFQAWVRVGSGDEARVEAGLSHALEHMLFKGTASGGVGDIAREIEGCGGELNAYTSFDHTVFHCVVPSRFFALGLGVVHDVIFGPALDDGEFEREKQVVLEEIRRGEDDPGSQLGKALFAEMYRVHPYGKPVIGSAESVQAFTGELLRDFHDRWYRPANVTLVIVGDVNTAATEQAVVERFGSIEGRPLPERRRPEEPPQDRMRVTVLSEVVKETRVEIGFPLPPVTDPDIPIADVLAVILGQGESSRLNQEIRLRRRLANQVQAYSYTPCDPGMFLVGLSSPPDTMREAVDATAEVLAGVVEGGVSAEETRRAVANILSDRIYERETVEGIARKLGYFDALFSDPDAEAGYYAGVAAVTPDRVRRFAARTFRPERATVAALVPAGMEDPSSQLSAAVGTRLTPPAVVGDRESRPQTERRVLDNGAVLLVREVPGSGIVSLRTGMFGGVRCETPRNNGVHNLMARVWPRGTSRRSALEIAEAMEEIAGRCSAYSGRNSFGVSSTFLSTGLDRGIELFREVLLEPSFDPDEVERMRALTLEAIKNIPDNPLSLGFLHFHRALYRRHPFRLPMIGTEASVARLTPGMLRSAYRRGLRGGNLVTVAVGDFDGGTMMRRLERCVGGLPGGSGDAPEVPQEAPLEGMRKRRVPVEKEQAHLLLGFLGARVTDPDRHALEMISAILGGQSGRLFMDLRDRQGLAYSVTAWSQEALDPGFFAVYIGTEKSKLAQARRGIHHHLRRICEEPVPAEEIGRAARYLAGSFEIGLQRGGAVATRILFDELYGIGHEALHSYPERILAVDADAIQEAAQRRLTLGKHVDLVLMPKRK